MILEVKNIAKINEATLELNGIPVIGGENDTGKSTFGKILYCLFNAFFHSAELIHEERVNSIRQNMIRAIPKIRTASYRPYGRNIQKASNYIVEKATIQDRNSLESEDVYKYLMESLGDYAKDYLEELDEQTVDRLVGQIKGALCIGDATLHEGIISKFFNIEFNGQINHINRPTSIGKISLHIKKKSNSIDIKANECVKLSHEVNIISEAIDNKV